jgi:hypothetical protein
MLLASTGCATFWDEVWSQERDWRYVTGINRPEPLVVIRDSTDGHRRAQALGELREPLLNGGNAQDQETYLKILDAAATSEREPICRLAAIRSLGKFRDPRAARCLEEIYQLPSREAKSRDDRVLNYTLEINNMIRKEALVALETTKDPDAWKLLVRVARQPGPTQEANLTDRQQTQDEKIVAIRALGNYRQQECIDALVYVMKTEKDIALRDRALASLEDTTGKKWPAPRDAWQKDDIRPQPGFAAPENPILRVMGVSAK